LHLAIVSPKILSPRRYRTVLVTKLAELKSWTRRERAASIVEESVSEDLCTEKCRERTAILFGKSVVVKAPLI